ncbi:MAG: Trk system potassium transporter TrkA [Clostridia bacterium]|nr:Trk system potassium transporter TrkA [Clostridia bacterium]
MKILIAGCGKVGKTLVEYLANEGYDLTVIDIDSKKTASIVERFDIMVMQGNCGAVDTLRQAGVAHADLLIAVTGSDELNLLCCATAHGINPKLHTIARIRNPEYAEQTYSMRDIFGVSMTFNPEKQAATEIERLIKYPGFLKRDAFVKGRVEIVELRVNEESKLKDVSLFSLDSIVKCKVLVCAVLRDGAAIIPRGNFILKEGDRVFVTAPTNTLALLLKNLGIVTHKNRRIILAGGGTVSYYLAEALQDEHIRVTLIEKDPTQCEKLAAKLPKVNVLQGDASNRRLMESEGLSSADCLLTLTGMDELNVIISMYGNSCGIPQIITKLERVDDARIIDKLPIGSVICPRKLCCNNILRYVRALQNQTGAALTVHAIADGQVEALEFEVDEHTLHVGKPLKEIKLKENVLLACITHHGKIEIPNGNSCFNVGDRLVVVESGDDVILQLNDIFS